MTQACRGNAPNKPQRERPVRHPSRLGDEPAGWLYCLVVHTSPAGHRNSQQHSRAFVGHWIRTTDERRGFPTASLYCSTLQIDAVPCPSAKADLKSFVAGYL